MNLISTLDVKREEEGFVNIVGMMIEEIAMQVMKRLKPKFWRWDANADLRLDMEYQKNNTTRCSTDKVVYALFAEKNVHVTKSYL